MDYGFELPDVRHEFYTVGSDETVKVVILRHYKYDEDYDDEDGRPGFDVSFNIEHGKQVIELPIGTHEETAIEVAEKIYPVDEEATQSIRELRAEEMAERRMGA